MPIELIGKICVACGEPLGTGGIEDICAACVKLLDDAETEETATWH